MNERLRARRKELRYSMEELAKKAGVSRQRISNLENDEHASVTSKTILKICEALETTPDKLFF